LREEEKQILVSWHRGEQLPVLGWAQHSPPGRREEWVTHRIGIWPWHPLSTLAQSRQSPGDSPGVGGTYPSQPTLGLFSANLVQNRGFPTRWQHQSNASSSQSAEEGSRVMGGCWGPHCISRMLSSWGVLGRGSTGAHLPVVGLMGRVHALSCQPTSKLPSRYRHRTPAPAGLGDAVRCILTESSTGPETVQAITDTPRAGGDPLRPPSPPLTPGGRARHLCSGGIGGPALPGAGSRGMVAAGCSRRPAPAACPATPGTAACSSPGSDCPACISTARAHLGEQPESSTAQLGSHPVLRTVPWDNRPRPLTSHEVSRLPLEPAWPWQATAGHPHSALGGQTLPGGFAGSTPHRDVCWRHVPGAEHTAPSIPSPPKDSPVPYQCQCCCAGRVGT